MSELVMMIAVESLIQAALNCTDETWASLEAPFLITDLIALQGLGSLSDHPQASHLYVI